MRKFEHVLVTGGTGFIRYLLLQEPSFSGKIYNLDKLIYATKLEYLSYLADNDRYHFFRPIDLIRK